MTCPHRMGDMCLKLRGPDPFVTDAMCAACPFTAIGCAYLRFALVKVGDGVVLHRATCAEKVARVYGVETCAGCVQHVAIHAEAIQPVERKDGKVLMFPSWRVRAS